MYSTDDWVDNWTSHLNYFQVSDDLARAGKKSYRFRVTKEDQTLNGNKRCELKRPQNFDYDEMWFGWSLYLEKDGFNGINVPNWMLSFQVHGAPDDGTRCPDGIRDGNPGEPWRNPTIGFFLQRDSGTGEYYFVLTIRADSKPCTYNYNYTLNDSFGRIPIKFDEWMDFVFHVNFRYNNTGFAKVWMDDEVYIDLNNTLTAFNDVKGGYLKIGMYGDFSNMPDGTILQAYYDEIRISDRYGSYDTVKTPFPKPVNMTSQMCLLFMIVWMVIFLHG